MSEQFETDLLAALRDTPLSYRTTPQYERQKEQPNHRVFLELAAQGCTPTEIATITGYSVPCISDVLLQPKLQKPLLEGLHENFGPDQKVVQLIKDNVVRAVEVQVSILNKIEASDKDRLTAANALLERRYGKATQPISAGSVVDLNNLPDSELAKAMKSN